MSYLHIIPYGVFISSPAYLLSQNIFGIIYYSKSESAREMTKLVYSYHIKNSEDENHPNDLVLDHLNYHHSFIYIPDDILSTFQGCEIEGNYHQLEYIYSRLFYIEI